MPITRSLEALSVVMMVVVTLGLVKLLLRRTYVKQGFAFGVMRRLQRPANYVRQVDFLRRNKNQVEADYETVQRAANKALDRIAEAEPRSLPRGNRLRWSVRPGLAKIRRPTRRA